MPAAPFPYFVRCPHCEKVLRLQQHIPSLSPPVGWTDGKGLGWPLRGCRDELYRCPSCGAFLWRSDGARLPSEKHNGKWTESAARNRGDLERALQSDSARTDVQRLWIRLHILWCDNDPLRAVLDPASRGIQIVRASVKLSRDFIHNADKLLELLDPADPREMLVMADLFRQLGRFQDATALLKNTVEVFFQTQEREVSEARAYNEQFRTPESEKITDLRPRVENLILLARFIAERALQRDPLVRPFEPQKAVFDETNPA